MKKGMKAIIITSAILIGTGIVATAAGLMMGASFRDTNLKINNGEWIFNMNDTAGEKHENWKTMLNESYTDIKSIDLAAGAGEVIIKDGDKFDIKMTGEGSQVRSEVKDGRWIIETKYGEKYRLDNMKRFEMTITLPKDFVAEKINIGIGAGKMTAETLRARELFLDVGAGSAEIEKLESQKTELTAGMGQIDIDSGKLTGKTVLSTGMGKIDLVIDGKAEDYGYDYDVAMGQVDIGGKGGAGLASEGHWGGDKSNKLEIDCGMGQVNVDFTEE